MINTIGYGCLKYILAITLPEDDPEDNEPFLGDTPRTHILAFITEAQGAQGAEHTTDNDPEQIVTYTQPGQSFILDISSIKCVVGRVCTKGMQAAGEWAVLDHTQLFETNFQVDECGSDNEEGWEN